VLHLLYAGHIAGDGPASAAQGLNFGGESFDFGAGTSRDCDISASLCKREGNTATDAATRSRDYCPLPREREMISI
jgi:hypothetical protein